MRQSEDSATALTEMSGRLADDAVRDLFIRFCREVMLFSDSMAVEPTPFEARFSDRHGFRVHVSPYHDLFRVSIDSENPCDIRVSAREGYVSALDLALKAFLDAHARAIGEIEGDGNPGGRRAPTRPV